MTQDDNRGHPIQMALLLLVSVAGAWYFFRHYDIDGLENVSIAPKADRWGEVPQEQPFTFTSNADNDLEQRIVSPSDRLDGYQADGNQLGAYQVGDPNFSLSESFRRPSRSPDDADSNGSGNRAARRRFDVKQRLRIASWALDGFGATKLASSVARRNLVRIARQFDVIALQQIDGVRVDLVPRLVDAINESSAAIMAPLASNDSRSGVYDYVMSSPMGPEGHREQLAILFNTDRVLVDRNQTYTVADPDNQLTYEPLVAWFRAAKPTEKSAWTFTIVNTRIELTRAPAEVALLANLFQAVREDGRGEDDVLLTGLFQADDAYLLPMITGQGMTASVRSATTDVFGQHQTANIIFDRYATVESLGVGGVLDFLRVYNLSVSEAQVVSSHLPVFAEFSPIEGGMADDASPVSLR
ncbi:MAG: deoxyribonuclease I [Planctomycetota bacterium]